MTIRECYGALGGDYAQLLGRLGSEGRIRRFLARFLQEESFSLLRTALAEGQVEEAFRAAHSLKGVCLNLELGNLLRSVEPLVEELRGGVASTRAQQLFEEVEKVYQSTLLGALLQIDAE